jgi:hypothetical protein
VHGFKPCLATLGGAGLAARPHGKEVSRGPTGATMPLPPPPYQLIAIARTIALGFTEQAAGHPEGYALTQAAPAIWGGIEVLEAMDRRKRARPLDEVCAAGAVGGAGPALWISYPARTSVCPVSTAATLLWAGLPPKG